MRDSSRISNVLFELEKFWEKYPDLRFMQLICNLQSARGSDLFYLEDEDFIELLKKINKKN